MERFLTDEENVKYSASRPSRGSNRMSSPGSHEWWPVPSAKKSGLLGAMRACRMQFGK